MSYELEGTVKKIFDEETFASGFNKRAFVVEEDKDKYPQEIKFECMKDKVKFVDAIKVGDHVKVAFDINGREWNGKYFVNLIAWSVKTTGKSPASQSDPEDEPLDEEPPF